MSEKSAVQIRPINRDAPAESWACADIMASTDPWITLGRDRQNTHGTVTIPGADVFVAVDDNKIVGVVIIAMQVPLIRGYIMGLAVDASHRNRGIGSALLTHAEDHIFKTSPNVFLCVSTFNTDAQRLYERAGYKRIGVIDDFVLPDKGEILLRKTLGPMSSFQKQEPQMNADERR